jgi:membrane associated rhomboid family serine protease
MTYRSHPGFRLTPVWVLIIVNILLLIAYSVNKETIINWFGLQPTSFLQQPWTIITSMFIHGGFWHLFPNMLTLFFFGSYLVQIMGDKRFLIVYFGGGILGNILFILLANPFSVVIGASGAVFALGGALVALRPVLRVMIFPVPAPLPLWVAVIGGFILLSLVSPFLGIAWEAHLGGLVFGFIIGYFFKKRGRYFY